MIYLIERIMQKEVYEHISKQTNDPIIERRKCEISGQDFAIFQSDIDFLKNVSPVIDGIKHNIPLPYISPEERQRQRLAWRNERFLYHDICDLSGKKILSVYHPDSSAIVYEYDEWRSDKRDPLSYGQNFDFSRSFFDQFKELCQKVPKINIMAGFNQNCTYVNACGHSKDCYLIFDSDYCENCMYSSIIKHSKNVVDSLNIYHCENIYNSINCTKSYNLLNCNECDNSRFLRNCSKCSNCESCYACTNLVNKSYCIKNKQYTKEEYQDIMKKAKWSYKYPVGILRSKYTVNSPDGIGNNLYDTKNTIFCHNIGNGEDLKYCDLISNAKNCYDVSSFGENIENVYYSGSVGVDSQNILFSDLAAKGCYNIIYSYYILNGCKNCFGCCGLHNNNEYCILNKQYTKEEYEKLIPKIIEHMKSNGERGQFFSAEISPFRYNETVAQEYYPLDKQKASKLGYKRLDQKQEAKVPEGTQTLRGDEEPYDSKTISDDILKKVIICEISGRPFRITKQELEFYRRHSIPLPRKHPDIRYQERFDHKPSRELNIHTCDKCSKQMLSVNIQKGNHTEYCESCYNQEFYG